jgi:group I intron endonuclease
MSDRRKVLLREYKQTRPEMGVYVIRNKTNGKCFVGSSVNIRARLNRHRMELAAGRDRLVELQRDWNELGADAFELETLDVLEPRDVPGYDPREDLAALERLWLEKLEPFGDSGYNGPRR